MPAAIWLISNNYINFHYHVLCNGKIITHSHPYNNDSQDPIQDHEHSDFEYTVLTQISSNSNSEIAETDNPEILLYYNQNLQRTFYNYIKPAEYTELPRLRAPPVI